MPVSPIVTYSGDYLSPAYDLEDALSLPVNLIPNTTFAIGTVLGQVTSAVNDVQTITITATGGTFTITYTDPVTGETGTTAAIAYNANAATQQTAINTAIGATAVAVTGTGPFVYTFSGTAYAGKAQILMTLDTSALTGGSATIAHTTTGSPAGVWKAYASGNSDGSQTPKMLLIYPCTTDGLGHITIGDGSQYGETRTDVPAYFAGTFNTADLTGLDSNAISAANWRLISGSVSSGVVRLG